MAKQNVWKSLEEFEAAKDSLERFPVNSQNYYNKRWRTYDGRMMFTERTGEQAVYCYGIYTIEEVRTVYLSSATEYEAAKKLFTEWRHWLSFIDNKDNLKYIEEFRMEREMKERHRIKQLLWKAAENGNVSAQKILLDTSIKNDYKPVTKEGQALDERLKQEAKEKEAVQAIKESLRLVSVDGKRKKA